MTTSVSKTIYTSRDAIRTQVIDFLQQYMELNEVDLTQSSFLSYIIDILTTLSSNLMFYQTNIYKEFFLTQAQLPESIHNLSSFLGYSPKEAKYATCSVLIKVWLPFTDPNTTFTIQKGFKFKTGDDITFVTYYKTTIKVINNTSVSVSIDIDGKIQNLSVNIIIPEETSDDPSYFQFILPIRQYKITTQEFYIDEDLELYQFTDKNILISGKVSNIEVYVQGSDDSYKVPYTKFNSLYLMTSTDTGYVLRVSPEGRKIFFGNGIIGVQPKAGSKITVVINETLGSDGNVIAGSITTGERIYSLQKNETTLIDYEVINPSPAFNGEDEEDLQEIRSNSIKSLVSLNRLVSEQDYNNFDVVIPNAPIKSNSIPILKRSDLKINEIQLYTIFNFGDVIVPSKNLTYTIGNTDDINIPRNTIINFEDEEYITIFEMTLDKMNDVAYYYYIITELQIIPTIIQTWKYNDIFYSINVNDLEIIANNDNIPIATFNLSYFSQETDFENCTCEMMIVSTETSYTMTNTISVLEDDSGVDGIFSYTFVDDYMEIPTGNQVLHFTISYTPTATINIPNPETKRISLYSSNIIFKKELKSFMLSNTFVGETETIIYDIPVLLKSYYDSLLENGTQRDFELQIMQAFLYSADFKNYRMLTDFINIKLCNTTGKSSNMTKHTPNIDSVKDIGLTSIPTSPEIGDRYIISGNEGEDWNDKTGLIAVCTAINPSVWVYITPKSNDIVQITNKNSCYIYSDYGWAVPIFDIPLKIDIEVFIQNDSIVGETNLLSSIKNILLDYYSPNFGPKISIRRSKIIDLIHNITGISHCRVLNPKTDIFFNYNIDEFSQEDLLIYSPEWIYFREEDITVKIFTLD